MTLSSPVAPDTLRRLMAGLFGRLGLDRSVWREAGDEVRRPVLDGDELHALFVQAGELFPGDGRHHRGGRPGEQPSTYLGRGLDFEELRRYEPGDDPRHMDWRATARTGRPYVKVFRETRQRTLHLVVDRGPGMRYGTRTRLKVTQAARLAALLVFDAVARHERVGLTLLEPQAQTFPESNGRAGAMGLVEALIRPCPPLAVSAPRQPSLTADLAELELSLPGGSRLAIISDFQRLDETDLPMLARLAARHELAAIQVLDPSELSLPKVGRVLFQDLLRGRRRWVDTANPAVREAFSEHARARHEAQALLLNRIGVPLVRCMTTDDAAACLGGMALHG